MALFNLKSMFFVIFCSLFTFAQDYYGFGHSSPRRDRLKWVVIDEVMFTNDTTAIAIANCKRARERDRRCYSQRDYQCSTCSEIQHSDQSSYVVHQLMDNHYGPLPGAGQRRYINTYHFYDKKTVLARKKCELAQQRMPECSSRRYECTPCTIEDHTDHSEFELYQISRY